MLPTSQASVYIATTASATPLPAPAAMAEWGLQGVIALMVLQKGWEIVSKVWDNFAKKDQAESQMFLQKEQAESELIKLLVTHLMQAQQQQHEDMQQIKEAIASLTVAIRPGRTI